MDPVSYTHLDVYKRQHTHTHTHTLHKNSTTKTTVWKKITVGTYFQNPYANNSEKT